MHDGLGHRKHSPIKKIFAQKKRKNVLIVPKVFVYAQNVTCAESLGANELTNQRTNEQITSSVVSLALARILIDA